ncbi:hypothetical protein DS2_11303 [Catenovulum agarivorans DS-2]|uniref:Endolytic murein transglycosylase n=1 Tax=Catenovulum agarivorans DS-2 TaxID=1328313 RepID=W7QWR6_9ALTE|nr:endolytic transglycosylase MltG [Catenovulum agarivorans]EWH09715.1 hypothetical protein DS2_11303 [Catenovulum agarivorans DS-2]
MLKLVARLILFVCVSMLLAGGYLYTQLDQLTSSEVTAEQFIEIPAGAHFGQVVEQLQQAKLVPESELLNLYFRVQAKLHPQFAVMQHGTYKFSGQYTPLEVLAVIRQGKHHLFSITLAEGSTFKQIQQQLAAHPQIQQTQYQQWLQQLIQPYEHPEGLFFPDTYLFAANTTDKALLRQAFNQMRQLEQQVYQSATKPALSWYQTLTLASIIEKETALLDEMPIVASVFYNRLAKNMRLQTDPTVIYGLGDDYQGDITRAHLKQATAYNTYVIKGLPPTPIAMPGLAAIQAAIEPAHTDYLYFVASGDGGHVFSKTLRQHNAAVAQYLKKIRAKAK